MPFHLRAFFVLLPFILMSSVATAQAPTESPEQRKAEAQAAGEAAQKAAIRGPSDIKLQDKGILHMPGGMEWVPHAEADRFMRSLGHQSDQNLLGLISGETQGHGWLAIVRFTGDGYVKDDEARDLDAAKVLTSLREGQDEANKTRVARGFAPLVLDDWLQPPRYEAETKHLIWALPVRADEAGATPTINYNTRALGREGFFSLNLLTDKEHFEAEKAEAIGLLKNIEYAPGHRYADFNPSTDKVAAYGLAALIGAVALKKLGLLALISAFVLKFAKVLVIGVVGLFAAIKAFFSRRKPKSDA